MSLWAFVCSVLLCSSVRDRKFLCERKKYPPWEKERSFVRERKVLRERKNTNHVNRKCQDILQIIPFSFREKAEYATRRGSSTFRNMPFLQVKDALLEARRASSLMLCVMGWFVVGYKVGYWRCYTPVLKMITLMLCNDFSHVRWYFRNVR